MRHRTLYLADWFNMDKGHSELYGGLFIPAAYRRYFSTDMAKYNRLMYSANMCPLFITIDQ